MRRGIGFAVLASLAFGVAALRSAPNAWSSPDVAKFQGDTIHSFVLYKVKHMGTSWAFGRFSDFTVSVDMAGADLAGASFVVKSGSVDTGNPARDKHVKSPDFLNAAEFPDITFKSTGVKKLEGDTTEVTGDLTLHGTTKPLTIKVAKVGSGKGMRNEELVGFETTFTVKRSDFGMSNMVGPVGDEITMTVAVEGAKK